MDESLKALMQVVVPGLSGAGLALLVDHLRRRSRSERYAEALFAKRMEAYAEIAEAAFNAIEPGGQAKLNDIAIRHWLYLTGPTVRLIHVVVGHPYPGPTRDYELVKVIYRLVAHMRDELALPEIEEAVLDPIFESVKKRGQRGGQRVGDRTAENHTEE